jgi:hypothetical protein
MASGLPIHRFLYSAHKVGPKADGKLKLVQHGHVGGSRMLDSLAIKAHRKELAVARVVRNEVSARPQGLSPGAPFQRS